MTAEPPAPRAGPPNTDALTALAVLGDESRRLLLAFVRRARRPVTREEAAEAVGISRKLAAFHLDKLVAAGVLRACARQAGAVQRRVGRAPKAYEPSPHPIEVSLPPRRHELLASLLAEAVVDQRPGEDSQGAALRAARLRGEAMGSRDAAAPSASGDPLACALAALERLGFEPETLAGPGSATVTVLRNCPFHPVAAQAPALVCGMNHAFVEGYLTGLGATTATAVLNPRPGSCCVELRTKEVGAAARATRPPRVACDREST